MPDQRAGRAHEQARILRPASEPSPIFLVAVGVVDADADDFFRRDHRRQHLHLGERIVGANAGRPGSGPRRVRRRAALRAASGSAAPAAGRDPRRRRRRGSEGRAALDLKACELHGSLARGLLAPALPRPTLGVFFGREQSDQDRIAHPESRPSEHARPQFAAKCISFSLAIGAAAAGLTRARIRGHNSRDRRHINGALIPNRQQAMPIRKPVLDPPFNVVRASHVELGVRDLAALARLLCRLPRLSGRATRPRTRSICAAVEERNHHSIVLRRDGKAAGACARLQAGERGRPRPRRRSGSRRKGLPTSFPEVPYQGRTLRTQRPARHAARILFPHGPGRAHAAELCGLSGRPHPAHRPRQLLHARRAGEPTTSTPRSASA